MTNVGIRILLVLLIGFGALYSQTKTQKDRQVLLALANNFVTGLYASDLSQIKSCISSKVNIRSYDSEEIKNYVDALILNKISSLDYLNIVTGLNINKIIGGESTSLKIIDQPKVIEEIYTDMTLSSERELEYFFLKVTLVLQEQGGAERSFHRSCEVDIFLENGEYKVFGFIL